MNKATPYTFRFSQFTCMFNLRHESASAEYRLTAWWDTNASGEGNKDDTQELQRQEVHEKHDARIECIS